VRGISVKIEFLQTGSQDCPLIRLFGTDSSEFQALHDALAQLASGAMITCELTKVPGIGAISDCRLVLDVSARDEGVSQSTPTDFRWGLTSESWGLAAGLAEPFATTPRTDTFQWLAGGEAQYGLNVGNIAVLISCSVDGRW